MRSSGFDLERTAILPYYGVTGVTQLRPLVKVVQGVNPKAEIVLHRDRDFLNDEEVKNWRKSVRALGVEPFVPGGRDMESQFINPKYLALANPLTSAKDFAALLAETLRLCESDRVSDYVKGRMEVARRARNQLPNAGALAVEANQMVTFDPRRHAGKGILRVVRDEYRRLHGRNLSTDLASPIIQDDPGASRDQGAEKPALGLPAAS